MNKIKNKLFSLMCKVSLHQWRIIGQAKKSGRVIAMYKCNHCKMNHPK